MITPVVQRWRDRRGSYRPAGECFDPRGHEVAPIPDDTTARAFVCAHHYSGSYPPAIFRFGLFERGTGALVGVAVISEPINRGALRPLPADAAKELGRFVLLDHVRANGETWFLARCRALLRREGLPGFLAASDPLPRADAAGRLVLPGHVGTIYQASNAVYLGRATPRTHWLLPDCTVFSGRAMQKIRARERGWRYAVAQLIAHGARPLAGDPRAWLRTELRRIARTVRHPGNHRYLFALDPALARALPGSLPYPKFDREAA